MNSSWLSVGQTLLATFAALQTILLIIHYGLPRDVVRSLGYLFSLGLTLILGLDALSWWGFHITFKLPTIYNVLLGVLAVTWPAFVWLGIADHLTPLKRKVMWRVPFVGALLGHAFDANIVIILLAVGWISGFIYILVQRERHRYVLRIFVMTLFISVIYWIFLNNRWLNLAQLCFAVWLFFTHKMISAFLTKNKMRDCIAENSKEA